MRSAAKFGLLGAFAAMGVLAIFAGCSSNSSPSSPATPVPPTSTFTACSSCSPTPTFTNSFTATPSPTTTNTSSATSTLTPSNTATQTATNSPTNSPTSTPTNSPTNTITATFQPTPVSYSNYATFAYNGVRGLAISGPQVYVSNGATSQVVRLDTNFTADPTWTIPGNLVNNQQLAVDPGGNLYVTTESLKTIYKFNSQATPVATITTTRGDYGIAFDNTGNYYVTSFGSNFVTKFDSSDSPVSEWSVPGAPYGIAVGGSPQTVYVGLTSSHVIATYDLNGNALPVSWVSPNSCLGLTFNSAGNLYVVGDSGTFHMARFTPLGVLQTAWGTSELALAVAVDGSDNIYVGDYSAGRVYRYTP